MKNFIFLWIARIVAFCFIIYLPYLYFSTAIAQQEESDRVKRKEFLNSFSDNIAKLEQNHIDYSILLLKRIDRNNLKTSEILSIYAEIERSKEETEFIINNMKKKFIKYSKIENFTNNKAPE